MSYTKLFSSIITSTIWSEDDKTRIVWITMLAMSDQHGEVQASIPGLAKISGVDIKSVELALKKFMSPDKYSRTKDDEGRRIEEIEGGWGMLNHEKYRKMASDEDRKRKNAERQKRFREKRKRNGSVTPPLPQNSHTDTEAEADTNTSSSSDTGNPEEEEVLSELWKIAHPISKSRSSKLKAQTAWRNIPAGERPNQDLLLSSYKKWRGSADWTKDDGRWVKALHKWIEERKWECDPQPANINGGGIASL